MNVAGHTVTLAAPSDAELMVTSHGLKFAMLNVNFRTGYWFFDGVADFTPPGGLARFLDNGEPPV